MFRDDKSIGRPVVIPVAFAHRLKPQLPPIGYRKPMPARAMARRLAALDRLQQGIESLARKFPHSRLSEQPAVQRAAPEGTRFAGEARQVEAPAAVQGSNCREP